MKLMQKKSVQGAIVLLLSLGIILAGTFAWFSFSQSALNILEGMTNPGGNLHDDFKPGENNKDVYVENNGNRPIYVRVRLDEYMDINGASVISGALKEDTTTWNPHAYLGSAVDNCGEEFHDYYEWTMGNSAADPDAGFKYYLPAPFSNKARFSKAGNMTESPTAVTYGDNNEKQEIVARYGLDSTYTDPVTGDEAYKALNDKLYTTDPTTGAVSDSALMTELKEKYKALDDAILANDNAARRAAQTALDTFLTTNNLGYYDKVYVIDDNGAIKTPGSEGTDWNIEFVPLRRTQTTAKVYTMAEWIAAGTPTGDFWIIDNSTPGDKGRGSWAYWGNVLQPGASTGLLLSEVILSDNNPPGPWYYGINVQLQAVTYDDISRFGLPSGNDGGGGITDQGMMVLQASSGDYVFDMQPGFVGPNDQVYTFVNNKDNTYRMMTTDGSGTVTYGPTFVYTGPTPPDAKGDIYTGDVDYQVGKKFNKDIPFGRSGVTFTVVETKADSGTGVLEGKDGKHYIKLSYVPDTSKPSDTAEVWLAVGADKMFNALTGTATKVSSGDDILVWTASGEPGTGAGDRFVEDASASFKIGDEFVRDGHTWVIIGTDTKAGSTTIGKTLIISKDVLEANVANSGIGAALTAYAANGAKVLTDLTTADAAIAPKLLTIQESMDFFADNAARAATFDANGASEPPPVAAKWWLSDGIVGTNGALNAQDTSAGDVGLRVAFWMDSTSLQNLLYPPVSP